NESNGFVKKCDRNKPCPDPRHPIRRIKDKIPRKAAKETYSQQSHGNLGAQNLLYGLPRVQFVSRASVGQSRLVALIVNQDRLSAGAQPCVSKFTRLPFSQSRMLPSSCTVSFARCRVLQQPARGFR